MNDNAHLLCYGYLHKITLRLNCKVQDSQRVIFKIKLILQGESLYCRFFNCISAAALCMSWMAMDVERNSALSET